MINNRKNKGFTIIELIVVMAIIGILVLLAMPKFMGNTQQARLTEIKSNTKQIENASERYYIDKQDWPRLSDVPYTESQIESFSKEIKDKTGKIITLDSAGSYYDIDYSKLNQYVQKPKDSIHYIIQNPVGEIYYLNELTTIGETRLNVNNKPISVITMTPEQNLTTTTNIIWTYNLSTDPDGDSIPVAEWTVDGIIKSNPNGMLSTGSHTISLKVQDSKGLWSQSVSTIVSVSTSQPLYVTNGLILDLEPNLYTGTQWTDKTLNMYNGTIKNFTNPTWGIVGGINGLRFTNSSNYLEFPAITANVKTIEYWIYLNTLATSVCTQVYQDPTIYHLLSIYNAYPLATLWADRTQSYSSVSPQLKVWQHVVVDTVNKKLYLNGKNVTTPMSISWTPDNFSPRFGQGYSGYTSFDGYLGSIRIYNRALTQAEITTNYGVGIK